MSTGVPPSSRTGETGGVRLLADGGEAAWDRFVERESKATFFHQMGWSRVLERTFGYKPRHLVAWSGAEVRGVLPLFLCRDIRGRAGLYSLPHTVYGGPVAVDAESESALLDAARKLKAESGAQTLELRNRYENHLDLERVPGFVTFEKQLPGSVDEVYRSYPKKAREALNQARKKHKLEAEFVDEDRTFYDLLATSYHSLGTPIWPRAFVRRIRSEFPDRTSILLVRHEGRAVAGVLSMIWRDTILPMYSGEAPGVARLRTSNFKYFKLMEHAVERGLSRFDFGRSRLSNEGVVKFKCNQGFEPEALPYQVEGAGPGAEASADPNRGFFARARRVWRRLPSGMARRLGPRLIRYFP